MHRSFAECDSTKHALQACLVEYSFLVHLPGTQMVVELHAFEFCSSAASGEGSTDHCINNGGSSQSSAVLE